MSHTRSIGTLSEQAGLHAEGIGALAGRVGALEEAVANINDMIRALANL